VTASQQYPFVVVSETELLYQISLEEQRLYDELQKSFADLEKARAQMSALKFDMPPEVSGRGVDFQSFSVRVEDIEKAVRETLRVATKVHVDYERILREMRTNRIRKTDLVGKVKDHIVTPLAKVRDDDFPYTQTVCGNLRKSLDNAALADPERLARSREQADQADKALDVLVATLREILLQMQGVVDIGKLIAQIRKIEQAEQESLSRIKLQVEKIENSLFEDPKPPKTP